MILIGMLDVSINQIMMSQTMCIRIHSPSIQSNSDSLCTHPHPQDNNEEVLFLYKELVFKI